MLTPSATARPPAPNTLTPWLAWLRRLLAWQVAVTRATYGALADDPHRGIYIPDAEADLLGADEEPLPAELLAARADLADERERLAAAPEGDRLAWLSARFGLSPFEQDVVLLALAPALDLRFERLYAYIQDDVTRKRPTIDLAMRLFCRSAAERIAAYGVFAAESPLRRRRLVQLHDDGLRDPDMIAHSLKLEPRVVAALLGHDALDGAIAPFARLGRPARAAADLELPDGLVARLRRALDAPGLAPLIVLEGAYGSGRRALAEALCAERGLPLLAVDGEALRASELPPAEAIGRVMREAALQGAALLWQGADALLDGEGPAPWRLAFLAALGEHDGPAFLAVSRPSHELAALRGARVCREALPELSYEARARIWRSRLGAEPVASDAELDALAGAFRLSGGQIRDAVAAACARAADQERPLALADLYAACRALAADSIGKLAWKVPLTYSWDDIVLPPDQLERLREIVAQVRHRRTVLERWGFGRHLAMGKGLNVLFAGESGTGKTMAAEIVAAELGLELYKVDLAGMVSKYIGETEKNLDRVFTAAREANAVLFFDEADAIFGKRSEVKDAHDRYANIEVGYLLQRIEAYDGVVILATNLRSNLDVAFVRRLHIVIDFPLPKEAERLRIWRKVFPPAAPLAPDVDLQALARDFNLAGGNIRNIALLAAYLAAEDDAPIGMAHIGHALRREYQKIGRMLSDADLRRLGLAPGARQ